MAGSLTVAQISRWLDGAGWLVFVGYLAAALLSALAVRSHVRSSGPSIGVRSWSLMVVFLLAMGFNKQLDLHQGIWNWTKQVARSQNWFEHRQTVHLVFVLSVGCLGLIAGFGLRYVLAHAWRHHRPVLFGLLLLLAAVVLRVMTLRAFEKWYGWRLNWHLNWAVELCGLALIAWGAARCIHDIPERTAGFARSDPSGRGRESIGIPDKNPGSMR